MKKTALFLFIFLILLISAYFTSSKIKDKGYNGLWDFVATISQNYFKGRKAEPEKMSIEIKDNDFKKLEKNRKQALERGVIINDLDGDYVPAVINYNGKIIDVKLRLKGHMTDHLQDNKWSFRIKIKEKDETFMGMKRFSIQHPGTRGYIYEWIYHELMKREDIIALRYNFINVTVNGNDWGIYAVEENFENELIENNNRIKAPILRFNPDLYWVNRYNEYTRTASVDEYASYYSANPEAYREDKVLKDSTQKLYYLKAIALIEGLRNKKVSVEDAFDIPRLAKFHSIIDLVGGVHSIDWSDIKYYYNPVNAKLEPVAYESFTNLQSRDLSCQYKYVEPDSSSNYEDWHSMIFSNEIFFAEYMKQLERVSTPEYLDGFFNAENIDLNKNLAIIYKEFPYKKFDKKEYYKRQELIRKIIDPPKGIHAYLNRIEGNTAYVQVAAIDALPVEIKAVKIGGFSSIDNKNIILPSKQRNATLTFKMYSFYFQKNQKLTESLTDSVIIDYTILGSSVEKTVKVFPFPHTDNEFISEDMKNKTGNLESFSFLSVDEKNKQIFIKSGKQIIDKDLIIPAGYKVFANQEVALDLKSKAKIISYSPFIFTGTEDTPLTIESSDSTSEGIELINAPGSKFIFVVFKNLPEFKDRQWARSGILTFYESQVSFINCSFYSCKAEDAVNIIRSPFLFKGCLFQKMENDALDLDFSEGTLENCVFENCHENAIDVTMSKISFSALYINGAGSKGLNVKAGSQVNGQNLKIKNADIAVSAEDNSIINLKSINISDSEIGVTAFKNKRDSGHPTVTLSGLTFSKTKREYLKEKKSKIIANGIEVKDEVQDVEILIKKNAKKDK